MTQTVPDISPLMPMHQDPLLVHYVYANFPHGEYVTRLKFRISLDNMVIQIHGKQCITLLLRIYTNIYERERILNCNGFNDPRTQFPKKRGGEILVNKLDSIMVLSWPSTSRTIPMNYAEMCPVTECQPGQLSDSWLQQLERPIRRFSINF